MEPARFSTASSNIVFSLLKAEVRTKLSFLQVTHTGTQRKQFLYKRKSQVSGTFASNLYISGTRVARKLLVYLSLHLQLLNQACRNFNEGSSLFWYATRSVLNTGPVDQWEEQRDPAGTL